MSNRKLSLSFILIVIRLLLSSLVCSTGFTGLVQAAPGSVVLAEKSGAAIPAALFPPTDINLSSSSVAENQPAGTTVGTLSTVDLDLIIGTDSHTYSLVSGAGDTDNSSFAIVGDTLQTTVVFNYEAQPNYSIRVRTTDSEGNSYEEPFTINVTNVNENPTDIVLNDNLIAENAGPNATVGVFSATDPDAGSSFTYQLVSGTGSSGNAAFNINGSTLRATNSLDFETQSVYSIRVRVRDNGTPTLNYVEVFTINVTDANDAPTNLSLSNTRVIEQQPSGTTVGIFSSTDQDSGDTHTYSLVSGSGSADNSAYTIAGNTLKTAAVFIFGVKNSYSIRVRTTDSGGAAFDRVFTISVIPKVYLPLIINPAPVTELYVFNDNTGGNVTVTVLGTYVTCTVPDNTTLFCGRFVAGTYDVYVVSSCGSTIVSKTYAGGPQTTRIFCF